MVTEMNGGKERPIERPTNGNIKPSMDNGDMMGVCKIYNQHMGI